MNPIASRGMSVLEFLRKPIAPCDFPGVGGGGVGEGLNTTSSGFAHVFEDANAK